MMGPTVSLLAASRFATAVPMHSPPSMFMSTDASSRDSSSRHAVR